MTKGILPELGRCSKWEEETRRNDSPADSIKLESKPPQSGKIPDKNATVVCRMVVMLSHWLTTISLTLYRMALTPLMQMG